MGNEVVVADIKPITESQNVQMLKAIEVIENISKGQGTPDFNIQQFLYEGVYFRTCTLKKGTVMGSALIKIPTTVIVSGDCLLNNSETTTHIKGFHVFKCSAHRRGLWYAVQDTNITMCFRTDAITVEEAEKEFTDEFERLK